MNGPSPESLCVQYAPGIVRDATSPLLSVIDLSLIVVTVSGGPYAALCARTEVTTKRHRKHKYKKNAFVLFVPFRGNTNSFGPEPRARLPYRRSETCHAR